MRKLPATIAVAGAALVAVLPASVPSASAAGECQLGPTGDLGNPGDGSQGRGTRPIVCLVDPNPYP